MFLILLKRKKIQYSFKVNKEMTVFRGETTFAFLKQIFDKNSDWGTCVCLIVLALVLLFFGDTEVLQGDGSITQAK